MIKIKVKEKKSIFKRQRDNYGRKLKKLQLTDYLRRELESSTTHALPYTVKTNIHWIERIFWGVSFMLCAGLASALLYSQYKRFIETPTVMSVEMDYFSWNVSYPAFTLCPYFKPDTESWSYILNESYRNTGRDLQSYLYSIMQSNMDTLELMNLNHPEILTQFIDPKDYAVLSAIVFKKIDKSSLTTNTNWLIDVEPVMTEVGMCHVMNSNVAKYDNPLKWNDNLTSPYVKNNIMLSVHDREFYSQIMNYADVFRIYIHSPDENILSTTQSYTQSDKGFLSFGVQVWSTRISNELRRYPVHIRKCRLIDEPISERYPIYSYNHCLLECKIKMIEKLCGCVPLFYKPLVDERICNIYEMHCLLKHKKEIMSFSVSEESSKMFNDADLPKSTRDCGCLNSCDTDIYLKDFESFVHQSDMNRLRIGISAFPKVRIVRNIIFSIQDIILRSGGLLNLCIGTSIISIVELIVMAIRILIYKLYVCKIYICP